MMKQTVAELLRDGLFSYEWYFVDFTDNLHITAITTQNLNRSSQRKHPWTVTLFQRN